MRREVGEGLAGDFSRTTRATDEAGEGLRIS